MRQIEIATTNGKVSAPASSEIAEIPDLAVTMKQFGLYEVTHIHSGYMLIGTFERAANAYLAMANVQLAFNELGIKTDGDKDELLKEFRAKNAPCKCLDGIQLSDWINLYKNQVQLAGEFPWESENDCPHHQFEQTLEQIRSSVTQE